MEIAFSKATNKRSNLSPFKPLLMRGSSRYPTLNLILIAGLVAGTLDIVAACIQFYLKTGKSPSIVLKYIASGVFGRQLAYSSGWSMVAWGLFFHFFIAIVFAALFGWMYKRWLWISRNIILSGVLYGIFVWAVMNFAIVPLSKIGPQPFAWKPAGIALLILVCMIGLPIALITHSYSRKNKPV